jgi:hypothetical protein
MVTVMVNDGGLAGCCAKLRLSVDGGLTFGSETD